MVEVVLGLVLFLLAMPRHWSERRRIVVAAAIVAGLVLIAVAAIQKARA